MRRQLGAIQISARQPVATNVELPFSSRQNRSAVRIHHDRMKVGQRLTDEASLARIKVSCGYGAECDVNARFRNAVHVDEARCAVAVAYDPWPQGFELERLAAEDDVPERGRPSRAGGDIGLNELTESRGGLVQYGHPFPANKLEKRFRRPANLVRDNDQPPPIEQGAPQLPDGKIEGGGMKEGPYVGRAKVEQ